MAINLLGCSNLRLGVSVIAIINIVFSLILLFWHIVAILVGATIFLLFAQWWTDEGAEPVPGLTAIGVSLLVIAIIVLIACLTSFVAAIVLLIGARKRDIAKCRIWSVVTLVCLIIFVLAKLYGIVNDLTDVTWGTVQLLEEILGIVIAVALTAYELWIVHAFVEEIKTRQRTGNLEAVAPADTVQYLAKSEDPPSYEDGLTGPGQMLPLLPSIEGNKVVKVTKNGMGEM